MAWLGVVGALRATLRNARRKPVTVPYPFVQRPRPERFRASFSLRKDEHGEELCVACLLCEKICPSQVIALKASPKRESPVTGKKRQYADDFTLDLSACLQCELCVQVCAQDALVMVGQPQAPGYGREDLFLTMDTLYANAALPAAWANGTRLMAMQEPPKPAPAAKPEPAAAPPAAAERGAA